MSETKSPIKHLMQIIIGLVIIAVFAALYLKGSSSLYFSKPVVIDTKDQPSLGNTNAKVHIVAFEDLKCVNCARFNNTIMPAIKKQYIDTGIATYTMINLAFIPGSMPAANAARCVYEQKSDLFFAYINVLYQNQPPENEDWANIPKLLDFASKVPGINTNQLAQCIIKSPYNAFMQQNMKQASQIMSGAVATPAVYVNGRFVKPLTQKQLEKMIHQAQ